MLVSVYARARARGRSVYRTQMLLPRLRGIRIPAQHGAMSRARQLQSGNRFAVAWLMRGSVPLARVSWPTSSCHHDLLRSCYPRRPHHGTWYLWHVLDLGHEHVEI